MRVHFPPVGLKVIGYEQQEFPMTSLLSPPPPDKSYADGDPPGSSSDSEDEVMGKYQEAVSRSQGLRGGDPRQPRGFGWETRHKYSPLSAEYDGYSSEVSTEEGEGRLPAQCQLSACSFLLSWCLFVYTLIPPGVIHCLAKKKGLSLIFRWTAFCF